MNFEEGQILLVDKPRTWTSFDVVNKLRFALKVKKIGHAGTLDPLATGLLIVCTGKATKQIQYIQDTDKEYVAQITLGACTDTYDSEMPPHSHKPIDHITEADIAAALTHFLGDILQVPPMYSAIKVDGKRAYKQARKGKVVDMAPRPIRIHSLRLLSWASPTLQLHVRCQKGTYIRSLAHDLGQQLGTGAYLSGLVRTAIGTHKLAEAQLLAEVVAKYGVSRKTESS